MKARTSSTKSLVPSWMRRWFVPLLAILMFVHASCDPCTTNGLCIELVRSFYSTEQCDDGSQGCKYANVLFVARSGGNYLPGLIDQDMTMQINDRNVGVEGSSRLSTATGLLVNLLLDQSYSITAANTTMAIRTSAVQFLNSLPPEAIVRVGVFASEATVPQYILASGMQQTSTGVFLSPSQASQLVQNFYQPHPTLTSEAATNLYDAVANMAASHATDANLALLQNVMVVFTDGTDTTSRIRTAAEARSAAREADPDLKIYAISLGTEPSADAMRTLSDNNYHRAENAQDLQDAFDAVRRDLAAIYRFRVLVSRFDSPAHARLTVLHDGAMSHLDTDISMQVSGGTSDCSTSTTCTACAARAGCGWCPSGGCMSGTSTGPAGGSCPGWAWTRDMCR